MGIFSPEKPYSKKADQQAEHREREEFTKAVKDVGKLHLFETDYQKASKALIEMRNAGHGEALELNGQYEKLKSAVQGAVVALEDFEKNKLGMHKERE